MARAWGLVLTLVALAVATPGSASDAPPGALPGCELATDQNSLDRLGGIWTYRCASGVTARFWLHPDGWPDAEAAFAEAFARMPEIDRYWRVREKQGLWTPEIEGADLVFQYVHEVKYRSLRGGQKAWVVPAGPRPRVLMETTWEVSSLAARIEAVRVLAALVAHLRGTP